MTAALMALALLLGNQAQAGTQNSGAAIVTSATPSGAAGGDLSGTYPSPTVIRAQAGAVSFSTITTALALKADDATVVHLAGSETITGAKDLRTISSTVTIQGNAISVNTSDLVVTGNKVGIGVATPATTLDVTGTSQFGTTAKSTFTTTGELDFANVFTEHVATMNAVSGAAYTVSFTSGTSQNITLTAACTINFQNFPAGQNSGSVALHLQQDASGSRAVTWSTCNVWIPGGTAPTLATTAYKWSVVTVEKSGATTFCYFGGNSE